MATRGNPSGSASTGASTGGSTGGSICAAGRRTLPEGKTLEEIDALVDRARGGDRAAFGLLVERFRPRIYALGLHLTGSRSEADDIAQEAFLRAFHQLGAFEGRSQFFTWLYRIAVNRALNGRRDGARRRTVGLDDPRVQEAIAIDAYGDPRRATELRQSYARLVGALDSLSPTLRSTVVLVALQSLSHEEAGVILGCPPGTVAWRMHEARARLRVAMEGAAPTESKAAAPKSVETKAAPIAEDSDEYEQLLSLVPSLRGAR